MRNGQRGGAPAPHTDPRPARLHPPAGCSSAAGGAPTAEAGGTLSLLATARTMAAKAAVHSAAADSIARDGGDWQRAAEDALLRLESAARALRHAIARSR
jgi:hypothetical protein